jgi:hypothetical protein
MDPGWGKKSGSRMNIPDHISGSLETIFGLKYFNSLMRNGIRDKHPGSVTLCFPPNGFGIRDPEKTYTESRGQKGTGSRIRIRNTAIFVGDPEHVAHKWLSGMIQKI